MKEFAKRTLVVVLIAGGAIVLGLLASKIATTLLLVFGGVLLAVFLNGLSRQLMRGTHMRYGSALGSVILILLCLLGGTGILLGPNVADQLSQLSERIPEALDQIEQQVNTYEWGRFVLARTPDPSELGRGGGGGLVSRLGGALSNLFNGLINGAILVIVGLYLAVSPGLYRGGVLHLVPPRHRARTEDVLAAIGHALRHWLIGRFASMAVVGILTAVGLWIIGVPLALSLGVIAALLSFVPNVGPLISVVPAIIIALMQEPIYGVYVVALYSAVQTVESYLITPLIQQKAVSLPPALLITAQVIMGVLFGVIGLFLATPLVVSVIVIVQMLYVEDVVGDDVKIMGASS